MKGYRINNEYYLFKSFDCEMLALLVKKYGEPQNYEINFDQTGIFEHNGEVYNIFDDSITLKDLTIKLLETQSVKNGFPCIRSNGRTPVVRDSYSYESSSDNFMEFYLYDED